MNKSISISSPQLLLYKGNAVDIVPSLLKYTSIIMPEEASLRYFPFPTYYLFLNASLTALRTSTYPNVVEKN